MPKNGMLIRIALALAAVSTVFALVVTSAGAADKSTSLKGAGSTFVAPLVNTWIGPVGSALGISLSYNPVGSGGGVSAITNKQVDFGASDAPLSQYAPTCGTCIQIPWALGGTAVMYNVPGAPNLLKVTGAVLAKIYLGEITRWNDAAIKKLNPGAKLPSLQITPVHRSDASGTSYNFTDFLSRVSSAWHKGPGTGTSVNWPAGIGAKGSAGVSGAVHSTPGGIGYADAEYSVSAHLDIFRVKNRAGKYVIPRVKGIKAAAELDVRPKADGSLSIVYPPASKKYANAYPISTYTYIDVQKRSPNAATLKRLISWAITKGQSFGPKIFFAPLPASVVAFDKKQLKKIG
jgi:phosphate transport system substrate-binding protein